MIEALFAEFANIRQFAIDDFKVVESPQDFYHMVLERIRNSESVYLACLVLGSGKQSKLLIDALGERAEQNRKTIVLIDKSRNLRNPELIRYIDQKALWSTIRLVDTTKCKLFPHAVNELLGVYHLKAYIFDDEVCISGANLDDSYFLDRIDRYYFLKNKELCQALAESVFDEFLCRGSVQEVLSRASSVINTPLLSSAPPSRAQEHEIQTRMFSFTKDQETEVLAKLLRRKFSKVYASTAYLNFTNKHIELLRDIPFDLYIPNPDANTFNNFSVLGTVITDLYTYSSYKTKKYLPKCNILEYSRPGCSFHAKGLWLFGEDYCITIIGSTNFNQRSIKVDEECSWVIISNSPDIRKKLEREVKSLDKYSRSVGIKELSSRSIRLLIIILYYVLNIFI